MPKIKIRFSPDLADITGKKELELSFNEKLTLNSLLKALIEKFGVNFRNRIVNRSTWELARFYLILINGKAITPDEFEKELKDGDIVSIMIPISGGQ